MANLCELLWVETKKLRMAQPGAVPFGRRDSPRPFEAAVPDPESVARAERLRQSAERDRDCRSSWESFGLLELRLLWLRQFAVSVATRSAKRAKYAADRLADAARAIRLASDAVELMGGVSPSQLLHDMTRGGSAIEQLHEKRVIDSLAQCAGELGRGYRHVFHEYQAALQDHQHDNASDTSKINVERWKRTCALTPGLKPISALLHSTVAPAAHVHWSHESLVDAQSAYAERYRQLLAVCDAMMRRAAMPGDLYPLHADMGSRLRDHISDSTVNVIRADWGLVPHVATVRTAHAREVRAASADTGTLPQSISTCATAGNVGTLFQMLLGVLRQEMTTLWFRDIRESDLPVLIGMDTPMYRSLSSEWRPMEHTGLHSAGDFLASVESDRFIRAHVQRFLLGVDNMVSLDFSGVHLGTDATADDETEVDRPDTRERADEFYGDKYHETRHWSAVHVLGSCTVHQFQLRREHSPWRQILLTQEGEYGPEAESQVPTMTDTTQPYEPADAQPTATDVPVPPPRESAGTLPTPVAQLAPRAAPQPAPTAMPEPTPNAPPQPAPSSAPARAPTAASQPAPTAVPQPAPMTSDGPLCRVWDRGFAVHPELPMNFATKETIAFLVKLVTRRAKRGGCLNFMCEYGAPTLKINAFVRAALAYTLGQPVEEIDDAVASISTDAADDDDVDDNDADRGDADLIAAEKILSPELYSAVLSVINVPGVFHGYLDIIKRSFEIIHSELAATAPLWRDSLPKVMFFLSCGDVARCYLEAMGYVVAAARFLLDQFRLSQNFQRDKARTMDQFEEWVGAWGAGTKIILRLQLSIDLLVMVKSLRDAMRAGLLEPALLVLEQLLEISAATGGDQYRQILADFKVMLRSCPPAVRATW